MAWSAFLVLALYPLELLFPAEKDQKLWGRFLNFCYMPFIIGFIYSTLPITNTIATDLVLVTGGLPKFVTVPGNAGGVILTSLAFAVIWDTWQYWVHRLQHKCPLLWPTHEFHHSETAMNASTHARTHVLSHVLYAMLWLPMAAVLGSIAPHWIAAFLMFKLWGYVIHANIRLSFGWLTPIIAGPQFHRIHHSWRPEHIDKNFATLFPWIDIVFGTYYRPARDEYPETGLAIEKRVGFFDQATIEPFRMWRGVSRGIQTHFR
jgi:sterol desaturase/sphingolipid hydroxylase (fatty acid hydroxylase superfamily)